MFGTAALAMHTRVQRGLVALFMIAACSIVGANRKPAKESLATSEVILSGLKALVCRPILHGARLHCYICCYQWYCCCIPQALSPINKALGRSTSTLDPFCCVLQSFYMLSQVKELRLCALKSRTSCPAQHKRRHSGQESHCKPLR